MYKNYPLYSCLFFCFFSAMALAVPKQFTLNPDKPGRLTTIEVPFPYRSILPGERFQYTISGSYVLMTPDSDFSFVLAGPLKPCILIRFTNEINQHILVFHSHIINDLDSLIKIAQEQLKITDPTRVRVAMFSIHNDEPEAHNAQMPRMLKLTTLIKQELKIPSDQIRGVAHKWKWPAGLPNLGQYTFLESGYVIVEKSGKLRITDPFVEDIYNFLTTKIEGDNEELSLKKRLQSFKMTDDTIQLSEMKLAYGGNFWSIKHPLPFFKTSPTTLLHKPVADRADLSKSTDGKD